MQKFLVSLMLFSGLIDCNSEAQKASLSVADFESKMQLGTYQLLDVRTAAEYQSGHLEKSLQADWNNPQQFKERTQYLDKSKPILVYCASGVRSGNAAQYLLGLGFKEVLNMQGGLTAWKMNGKTVASNTNIPQMRLDAYAVATTKEPLVLVDFGAEWCPPCKKMEPVLNALLADASLKFSFVKVDGGNDLEVMKSQNVEALPVFVIYKNGKEIWRKQGVVDQAELKKILTN
jgi:rhodanese-related sulfurtransferase/glutaredoxin